MRNKFLLALCLVFALPLLAGCGGGGGTPVASTGRAVFNIVWPTTGSRASRLIPAAALSIKITLTPASGGAPVSQIAVRPAASLEFDNLPVKQYSATAVAYATNDGTGVALSTTTINVTTVAAQVVNATLTLESTIDHLVSDYAAPDLLAAETATIGLSGRDTSNAIIPVTAGLLTWASSDTSIVTVSSSGVITGVGPGTATVTATDTESGKTVVITVHVMTFTSSVTSATVSVGEPAEFSATVAGPTPSTVTWSVSTTNTPGGVSTGAGTITSSGVYTAPSLPGTYYAVATSDYDPARKIYIAVTVQAGSLNLGVN